MDIAMPGLDGITATRHLRTLDPAARIVIVTNHDQPDLRDAAHAAGACTFVAKSSPVELHAILAGMSG